MLYPERDLHHMAWPCPFSRGVIGRIFPKKKNRESFGKILRRSIIYTIPLYVFRLEISFGILGRAGNSNLR